MLRHACGPFRHAWAAAYEKGAHFLLLEASMSMCMPYVSFAVVRGPMSHSKLFKKVAKLEDKS